MDQPKQHNRPHPESPDRHHTVDHEGSLNNKLPELLCPAGSPEALDAALEGGADAVYLGGPSFNARANARNFSWEELEASSKKAHALGAKLYLTLNTQVYDRELQGCLEAASTARHCGVDGLIVADFGVAMAIRELLPDLPLHASTQASGHSLAMAQKLAQMGYARMVCARELSAGDLKNLCAESPIEIEAFVHGALCVCHSGQCLFSSLVGGRSGNRGECAQPCRLPYGCAATCNGREYPMSLKDLSLAPYVPELIAAGVRSLKIEGRMKAPEYVYGVAKVWRRLLDDRRAATREEMRELADLFSRGGFTDGYYTGKINASMLGVRSEADKSVSRSLDPFAGLHRKAPISLRAGLLKDQPLTLTAETLRGKPVSVTVEGQIPEAALNAPLSREAVLKNLTKFGNTRFEPSRVDLVLDEGLMLPVSAINAARRALVETLEARLTPPKPIEPVSVPEWGRLSRASSDPCARNIFKSARFSSVGQITPSAVGYFDEILLPATAFESNSLPSFLCPEKTAVLLPPVVMDSEREIIDNCLQKAADAGIRRAYVGNLGQIDWVRGYGMTPVGDFRLNLCNCASAAVVENLGVADPILSPELSLPQLRDLAAAGKSQIRQCIVYGRIPLMVLEKCLMKDKIGCEACRAGKGFLSDRRGVQFPVLREFRHRNLILNSVPTYMADRIDRLKRAGIPGWHFLFTVESASEVDHIIDAYSRGLPATWQVRRIADS